MKSDTFERVYVDVKAAFNAAGSLIPLEIKWIDGKVFEIDRVTDIRQAAAMKAGGQGDRYTVWSRSARMLHRKMFRHTLCLYQGFAPRQKNRNASRRSSELWIMRSTLSVVSC